MASLTVGDGHVTELSVGTDQRMIVTLRDDLGKSYLVKAVNVILLTFA